MSKTSFAKISNRIERGDQEVYRELLRQYGPSCVRSLMKKANCSAEEAEEVMLEALLHLRDQVLRRRISHVGNLKEYLSLASWEIWRKQRKQRRRAAKEGEVLKQAFFEQSQKRFGRQEQLEIVRAPEEYFARLLASTREAITALPDEGQQVLNLYYQEKRNLSEIALIMGLSGEEEAAQLKTRYYTMWMNQVEHEVQYNG